MAIVGGVYVWVEEENLDTPVEVASHPVETGVEITSHVKAGPATLTVRGEIVGPGYENTVQHFRNLARGGYLTAYIGRTVFPSAHIVSFGTRASPRIKDGVEFDMQLREMRVARKNFEWATGYTGDVLVGQMNYDGTASVENLSAKGERYHTLMAGETLYFVAEQYRSRGVTAEGMRELNQARDVFQPGHQGDYGYLRTGAKLLLGVW